MSTTQKKEVFRLDSLSDFAPQLLKRNIAISEKVNDIHIPYEKVGSFVSLMQKRMQSSEEQTRSNVLMALKRGMEITHTIPERQVDKIMEIASRGVKEGYWQAQQNAIWLAQHLFGRSEGRQRQETVRSMIAIFERGSQNDNYHVVRGEAIQGLLEVTTYSAFLVKELVPNCLSLFDEFINQPKNFGYGGLSDEGRRNNRAADERHRKSSR